MQRPTVMILTALAGGSAHGYAIKQEVENLSQTGEVLRVGTLYAALDRLTQEGLVEVDREELVDSRLRRYYKLTSQGRTELEAQAKADAARSRLALRRLKAHGASA